MLCLLQLAILLNTILDVFGLPAFVSESTSNVIVSKYDFEFVNRQDWGARSPQHVINLTIPVPYVVIHHTYVPGACYTRQDCERAMRSMQNFHMDTNDFEDIGYSFAVGADGVAYEGRGWTTLGAHSLNFNSVSIGVALIGDWRQEVPPTAQLETAKALIKAGVQRGYLRPDYRVVGHRQVRATECPGDALFKEINTWAHYSPHPSSVDELIYVEELPLSVKKSLLKSK